MGFRIATRFPFGLFEKSRETAAEGEIIIYPATDPLELPAKADGRWAAAYAPPSLARIPAELLAAIEAVPAARATLGRLDSVNRFALAHRFGKLKTDAGRERAIERYVQMLARGETIHPLGPGAGAAAGESSRSKPSKRTATSVVVFTSASSIA